MKIFYYSGTHWDREWYQTFQGFRKRLVEVISDIITVMENGLDYGTFNFDGQTIVFEDFLEIRPEMKDRLTALIQSGKIVIGPWYDMPDEFLVSGESLIKNLRLGKELCHSFGVEPSKNAYICDIFGHSSQTPQIFAGMNYHNTVLARGACDGTLPSHFSWEALDGTRVSTFRLSENVGYGDMTNFCNSHPSTMPKEELDAAIKAYVDGEIARADGVPVIILMDALDHRPLRIDTNKYLESIKRVYPDAEVYHSSIDLFCDAQSEYADKLVVRRGELCRPNKNQSGFGQLIAFTLSSRYPLKKYNDINQTRIEIWASPLYALRQTKMAPGFLILAVKYMLKNHPHDSICGCSIDAVHKDMIYRFDQTSNLCDEIINPFTQNLGADIPEYTLTEEESKDGLRLRIFNPLPYRARRTVVVDAALASITHYSNPFFYEQIPAFRLYDCNENEIEYGFAKAMGDENYKISFEAELNPCGITEFYLAPSLYPTRNPARLLTSERSAKGDYLEVKVNDNGTVDLTDLTTGEVYHDLLTLIDDGEIGDGWYHCCPNIDTVVTQTTADISIIENSPVRTTFAIKQKMNLPREMTYNPVARSKETVEFTVTHEVSLAKGDRGLTVKTYVDNNVKDHRLRLRFPKVVEGDTYEAAQAFGYVSRTCGDDPSTFDWQEYDFVEKNMAGICAKRAGKRGLAFVSAHGLHECGVWQDGDMDITLFRAFRKTVNNPNEPNGQIQEHLEFNYRILPFTADDSFSLLQKEQDFLATGLASATLGGGKARRFRPMLEVTGNNIIYSTAELYADGASGVRVFNDGETEEKVEILLPLFATKASLIELDGRLIKELELYDGKVEFNLPPFRIATVRFE